MTGEADPRAFAASDAEASPLTPELKPPPCLKAPVAPTAKAGGLDRFTVTFVTGGRSADLDIRVNRVAGPFASNPSTAIQVPARAMILVSSRSPGYYGKVPARGDFVSRRLSRNIVDPWDDWLQRAIRASREQLGSAWRDLYRVAPIWRFVMAGGLCGPSPLAGIMMSSVDSVGRDFPLLVAAELPPSAGLGSVVAGAGGWFEDAEAMALGTLRDGFKLEDLDRPAADLIAAAPAGIAGTAGRPRAPGLCVPLSAAREAGSAYGRRFGDAASARLSLWWTAGSERVRPALAVADGLPALDSFAPFLDGDWQARGWRVAPGSEAASAVRGASASVRDRDE